MLVYQKRAADRAHFPRPRDMPGLLHALLIQRGIASEGEAQAFLNPGEGMLNDPMLLSSMPEAVARIRRAVDAREKICVYGDYDVDGVGAAAILYLHLKSLGADVRTYLPSRHDEGYGLNEAAVRSLAAEIALLVTVDCGIGSRELVALSKSLGMDVVVTDHHRPGEVLPDCPVVNPLLNGYPCPHLSGAGVAWKLVEALSGRKAALELVDLAALSTVADVVPLVSENRAIVRLGLDRLNGHPRVGIRALREVAGIAGIAGKALTAAHIGFQIAPRLNAGGRLGSAGRALRLLITGDREEAAALAAELEAENVERRRVEAEILREAEDMLRDFDFPAHRAIVLAKDGWNAGALGLAASRLVERYHCPAILMTSDGDRLKGSCRSISGVDIFGALSGVREHLERFGGHRQAAGLSLPAENLGPFAAALDDYLWRTVPRSAYVPSLEYDLDAPLSALDPQAVMELDALEPTGMGNPAPVLRARATVASARAVGKDGAHLKLTVAADDRALPAVLFSEGARANGLSGEYDMLFAPRINAWMGRATVELQLRALEPIDPAARISANLPGRPALMVRFLTEMLYNRGIGLSEGRAVPARALRKAFADDPQGTLVVCRDFPQALYLIERLDGLRFDLFVGGYPPDPRAFNAVCVLPVGDPPRNYRQVIPAEDIEGAPAVSWEELPDVDGLRDAYRAIRRLSRRPAHFTDFAGLCHILSEECDLSVVGSAAALLALQDMHLIELPDGGQRLRILPAEKTDPLDSAVVLKILRLRAEGREGSGREQ
ncbi:MAG: single-stranded-DNA-specific exonuclease RecJ [Clostridiales bacterium]|nr:single-stranded-DNA-specific exonuclease RecJ [Clostridiales bacterium]